LLEVASICTPAILHALHAHVLLLHVEAAMLLLVHLLLQLLLLQLMLQLLLVLQLLHVQAALLLHHVVPTSIATRTKASTARVAVPPTHPHTRGKHTLPREAPSTLLHLLLVACHAHLPCTRWEACSVRSSRRLAVGHLHPHPCWHTC
jgi:hypothetical protein